ncbi:MAG TPA: cbb3-type cytochrome c oxidase subunit I [Rhodocyclaceae bacterium]|nr:cbb3-type cytochrome c oxidase subunit I [Rhodocyclaceae bacterium]
MTNDRFLLAALLAPTNHAHTSPRLRLARAWLLLGVAALIGAGLLAILLVVARTPGVNELIPIKDFFRAALIVHVDLSVLIWFMAFGGVLWSLAGNDKLAPLGWGGVALAVAGSTLMVVSPFCGDPQPLLNNYIPILQQPVFFTGLCIAGAGFMLTLLRALLTAVPQGWRSRADVIAIGVYAAAIAGSLAFLGFVWSWLQRPDYAGRALFEAVFWGGGHTLQFQHALLMTVAWLLLLDHLQRPLTVSPRILSALFVLAALPVLGMPLIYLQAGPGTPAHVAGFAKLMEHGHSLMLPLIVLVALALPQLRRVSSPVKSALFSSVLLFLAGGVLAFMIRGVNVVIPAHYHGSIVGVTLAFMGLAYALLPQLGYAAAAGRMARWQPYVYGGGQLIHILGLAWSGGYGVQRKVAGSDQILLTWQQKAGMGMMGLGGLIAIIGGIMFVLVCIKSMRTKHS